LLLPLFELICHFYFSPSMMFPLPQGGGGTYSPIYKPVKVVI
jgi:hypothetical protein